MALFIIGDTESFWYPVELTQRSPTGALTRHKVPFQFKRLDTDQLHERRMRDGAALWADLMIEHDGDIEKVNQQFSAQLIAENRDKQTSEALTDDLLEIVSGWKEVGDIDGPWEFNRDNLHALVLKVPGAAAAIKAAFNEAHSTEGKEKNSARPRATG